PDFIGWLQEEGMDMLIQLGSRLGPLATRGEPWVFVAHKGHAPIFESLIISRNSSTMDASPLAFSGTISVFPGRQCPWYKEPELVTKAEFCETYEGYHRFCDCQHPLHLHPGMAPYLQLEEVIPVALVTARRFPTVLRQVQQLWQSPGGSQTPLAILVDGHNTQAHMLAQILNITAIFHDNPVPKGTKHRVNQHIKFSLRTIFELYPEVDKAIILEDDLSLAPDFISYFQQTSLLMSVDKTVLCVNAYSYSAFPHTASDPSRIYRVHSYPYYGWMTSRVHALTMLGNWAPLDINADWDLYVRHYHVDATHEVIIPEVPRTRHEGGGGVHVTGLEQETTYDQRPLNTLHNVTINLRRQWHLAYALDLMATIKGATVVKITKHPCVEYPIPKYLKDKTHVIYIYVTSEEDKEHSFTVLGKKVPWSASRCSARFQQDGHSACSAHAQCVDDDKFDRVACLGFYYQNLHESYHGTVSFKFFETPVILIPCHSTVYCDEVPDSLIYRPTKADFTYAKKHSWKHTNSTAQLLWRAPPRYPEEEFNLINVRGVEIHIIE
ncbi:O-linked-mannose beta-1-2-N-acetylglucosaminyltransferase 1-like 11, partial [Homarus americanus]